MAVRCRYRRRDRKQLGLPDARFGRTAETGRDCHTGFLHQGAAKDPVVPGHPARPPAEVEYLDRSVLPIEDVKVFAFARDGAGIHNHCGVRDQEDDRLPPSVVEWPIQSLGSTVFLTAVVPDRPACRRARCETRANDASLSGATTRTGRSNDARKVAVLSVVHQRFHGHSRIVVSRDVLKRLQLRLTSIR